MKEVYQAQESRASGLFVYGNIWGIVEGEEAKIVVLQSSNCRIKTLSELLKSADLLVDSLRRYSPPVRLVLGLSHRRVAALAKRFGFEISPVAIGNRELYWISSDLGKLSDNLNRFKSSKSSFLTKLENRANPSLEPT